MAIASLDYDQPQDDIVDIAALAPDDDVISIEQLGFDSPARNIDESTRLERAYRTLSKLEADNQPQEVAIEVLLFRGERALARAEEVHEGAEVHHLHDLAVVDLATLDLLADPHMDPASLVMSFDLREAIGVRYGRGAPAMRYFDESHPHVAMYRLLEREFPGEAVHVTSATRDGRLAVVLVASDREPGRYYLLDIVSGDMRPLVEHRGWLDRGALATQRPVEFARRDGGRLDGYLTLPASPAAAGAPLVALVHGGPYGVRDSWGFDHEVQMLAAHGYAVLQVNFRGSAGRGRDFMESGYREWGRGMIDDIVDGVRWARGQPGVSPSRSCIWGASYGGYAALMGVAKEPSLYRCAAGAVGVYDLPMMHTTGDIQRRGSGETYLREWIGDTDSGQLGYFRKKGLERIRKNRITERLAKLSLLASVIVIASMVVAGSFMSAELRDGLMIGMGSVLLLFGIRQAYAHSTAEKELIKQYEFMLRIFHNARRRLGNATDSAEQRQILRALGGSALDEHAEWILMHRDRSLDQGEIWRMGS